MFVRVFIFLKMYIFGDYVLNIFYTLYNFLHLFSLYVFVRVEYETREKKLKFDKIYMRVSNIASRCFIFL